MDTFIRGKLPKDTFIKAVHSNMLFMKIDKYKHT